MTSNTIPHPPNSAWLPPIDPNDEETLEQQQLMIQQQFKNILTQDGTNALGAYQTREEDEQDEQDDEGDDMEEYADQIQIPGDEQI